MSSSGPFLGDTTTCNKLVDLDCNGVIESWERANDFPRIVHGLSSLVFSMSATYIIGINAWTKTIGFKADTWQSLCGLLNMIFSIIFALPLFFMWLFSYSGSLGVLDAFYIWSYVNSWYYITGFWILQIFWFVASSRKNTSETIMPDTYDDHSLNISII